MPDIGPNTILKIKKKTLTKFCRPPTIIVHYTIQFNLGYCKSSLPDMGPNTISKIKKKLSKGVLKVKLNKFQNTILMKFGRPIVARRDKRAPMSEISKLS